MTDITFDYCPKCGSAGKKDWGDLDEDEKRLAGIISGESSESLLSDESMKYCARCYFEFPSDSDGEEYWA